MTLVQARPEGLRGQGQQLLTHPSTDLLISSPLGFHVRSTNTVFLSPEDTQRLVRRWSAHVDAGCQLQRRPHLGPPTLLGTHLWVTPVAPNA